jgi:hypothetical protein
MKQRTAMQTLIDEISKSPISNLSILNLIEDLQLIEMEKEQIMGAYDAYAGFAVWGLLTAEDYYNETFNPDDK